MEVHLAHMEVPIGGYDIPNPTVCKVVGSFNVFKAHKEGHEYIYKSERFADEGKSPEGGYEHDISIAMNHPCVSKVMFNGQDSCVRKVLTFRKYPRNLETLDATSHLSFLDVQKLMKQLMQGLNHIHGLGYVHLALQPENIMVDETGGELQLKIFNFAYAKPMNNPTKLSFAPLGFYLPLAYWPYEKFMSRESPNGAIDMWCAGCVMARMIRRCKIFREEDTTTVMNNMLAALGLPSEEDQLKLREMGLRLKNKPDHLRLSLPDTNSEAIDFISKLLSFDPSQRLTPLSALQHGYFASADITERKELTLPNYP